MKENNELIAEFMGIDNQIISTGNVHSWSDAPFYYITEDSKEKVMKGIIKYSKYHTSWDWLMPVVRKCHNIDRKNIRLEIGHRNMYGANREIVHKAVVEFIKNQNK